MSKKEKLPLRSGAPKNGDQQDEQIIIDLIKQRKLQQDALKKIITSMDKSNEESNDPRISDASKGSKAIKPNQTKLI